MFNKIIIYLINFLTKYFDKTPINDTILKTNIVYKLFVEGVYTISSFFKIKILKLVGLFKYKQINYSKYISLSIPQYKLLKALPKRRKKYYLKELSCRFYVSREEIYEVFISSKYIPLFKHEWKIIYQYLPTLHQFWLIYTFRPFFYFKNWFSLRSTNFYKLFNVVKQQPGIYTHKTNLNYFNIYWGFISFLKALRIWIFSLCVFSGSLYILLTKRIGVLPQTLFFWVCLFMLLYWLLSGFVFFVKKYQFSRYTSVVQRFWRRSYIIFWLLESSLLLVFFYLMVNPSQEAQYMFDQIQYLKTHLFSWKLFLFKCIILVSLITYGYIFLLNLKWSSFGKNILMLCFLTVLLIYFLWIEFYQIYWVSNFYANFFWMFDADEGIWTLEWDARRTRILNHYIMILFLLKFWHIVFIFICWIFFLLRTTELELLSYPLYSFNFQNFIILFLMTWLFMYPWFRHTYHWIVEIPYYWFYVDTHISFYKIVIFDLYTFYYNIYSNVTNWYVNDYFNLSNFINFQLFDAKLNCNEFIKLTIKDQIINKLTK